MQFIVYHVAGLLLHLLCSGIPEPCLWLKRASQTHRINIEFVGISKPCLRLKGISPKLRNNRGFKKSLNRWGFPRIMKAKGSSQNHRIRRDLSKPAHVCGTTYIHIAVGVLQDLHDYIRIYIIYVDSIYIQHACMCSPVNIHIYIYIYEAVWLVVP